VVLFDVGQVEVLTGAAGAVLWQEQPGGVISLRTQTRLTIESSVGQGTSSNPSSRGELIVSGPVTDTLKLRLAACIEGGRILRQCRFPIGRSASWRHRSTHPTQRITWCGVRRCGIRQSVYGAPEGQLVYDRRANPDTFSAPMLPTGTVRTRISRLARRHRRLQARQGYADPVTRSCRFPADSTTEVPFLESHQSYGTLDLNYLRPTR